MRIRINGNTCCSIEDVRACASEKTAAFIGELLAEENYVVAHTSGSTGVPKEIRLLKSDMRASARLTNDFFGINDDSLLYLCLSPDYIAGKMMIVRAIEAGAEIVEQSPSNEPMAGYASNRRVSLLAVVPSQLGYLVNHPEYLDMVDFVGAYREVHCVVASLGIADVDSVEEYRYLLAGSSPDADVGLHAHHASLAYVHANRVFEKVVHALGR